MAYTKYLILCEVDGHRFYKHYVDSEAIVVTSMATWSVKPLIFTSNWSLVFLYEYEHELSGVSTLRNETFKASYIPIKNLNSVDACLESGTLKSVDHIRRSVWWSKRARRPHLRPLRFGGTKGWLTSGLQSAEKGAELKIVHWQLRVRPLDLAYADRVLYSCPDTGFPITELHINACTYLIILNLKCFVHQPSLHS